MQSWSKGVELEMHGVGGYRTVKSTEDAAQCLLAYWPTRKGKAYVSAQQACLAALEGTSTPELAREAFISAALAAKIHIRSMQDPRASAMQRGGEKNKLSETDSQAWRTAYRRAMEAVKASIAKQKRREDASDHDRGD